MKSVFVGIDVACSSRKKLPVCFVEAGEQLTPVASRADLEQMPPGPGNREVHERDPFVGTARKAAKVIAEIAERNSWRIERIAIDAPAKALDSVRQSEKALAESELSVFSTPTNDKWREIVEQCKKHRDDGHKLACLPHANKIWMLYGFRLYEELRQCLNVELIETYPHAIVHSLHPDRTQRIKHKKKKEGYRDQLKRIAARTGWNSADALAAALKSSVPGSPDDRLDAFMSAWVASLPPKALHAYGDPKNVNDCVWAPKRTTHKP